MLWVLWDIVLPLIAAFLLGLFIGWMLWRWRRKRIDADGLSALRRSNARYKADAERLEHSNIELSDRLQAASGTRGGDLANARKRIDMLADELKESRREVADLKSAGTVNSDQESSSADLARIRELESQLQMAESRLATSEQAGDGSTEGVDYLRGEIEARDRMIATLRESHDQYGESGDNTSLLADIALRDRKIDELEAQLGRRKA